MTKSTLLKLYSIVKIVKAKELPLQAKTYKDSQERLLVMFKKGTRTPRITLNDLMKEIKSIKSDLSDIKIKLDKHDELFRLHGWIK